MYCLGATPANMHGVGYGSIVRRLTPVECERLQGVPDGWTAKGIDAKGKVVDLADAPRYRILGNGVTANVSEWLAAGVREIMKEEEQ